MAEDSRRQDPDELRRELEFWRNLARMLIEEKLTEGAILLGTGLRITGYEVQLAGVRVCEVDEDERTVLAYVLEHGRGRWAKCRDAFRGDPAAGQRTTRGVNGLRDKLKFVAGIEFDPGKIDGRGQDVWRGRIRTE